jgi:hypothetical protein
MSGFWSRLDAEELVDGTLAYDADEGSLRLELRGESGSELLNSFGESRVPLLRGRTDGGSVAILDAVRMGRNCAFMQDYQKVTLAPTFAIFGPNFVFESADDLLFDEFRFEVSGLKPWYPYPPLSSTHEIGDDDRLQAISFTHRPRERESMKLSDGTELGIAFPFVEGGFTVPRHDFSLREDVLVTVKLAEPIDVPSVIRRFVGPMIDFVTLATDVPSAATSLTGIGDLRIGIGRVVREGFDVVFQTSPIPKRREKTLAAYEQLFTAEDIERIGVTEILVRWYDVANAYRRVGQLLFSMRRAPRGTYAETRFLTYVQATEVFHRLHETLGNDVMNRERYEARRGRIDEALAAAEDITEKDRKWLRSKLDFSNQPTLRTRLKELRRLIGPSVDDLFTDDTIEWIVITRDYLTHNDPGFEDYEPEIAELLNLIDVVRFFAQACFLQALGLTGDEIGALLRRNGVFADAVHEVEQAHTTRARPPDKVR